MAFSTQKDFLKIGFINEHLEPKCDKKFGNRLKSYSSCTDPRAWVMNKEKQAHYLSDLVACRTYGDCVCEATQPSGGKSCEEKLRAAEARINCLQDENNRLKKGKGDASPSEIARLRCIEGKFNAMQKDLKDFQRKCTCGSPEGKSAKDKTCALEKERDSLRDKLNKMCGIGDKIEALKKRAMEADCLENEVKSLNKKCCQLEQASAEAMGTASKVNCEKNNLMQAVQSGMKNADQLRCEKNNLKCQLAKLGQEMERLRCQNTELCQEIQLARCQASKLNCVEQDLINTKKKLAISEKALDDYEFQMHQLMDVIEELQSRKCCCDAKKALKDEHVDNLVMASKLALQQMKKDISAQSDLLSELEKCKRELKSLKNKACGTSIAGEDEDDCKKKLAELQEQLRKCNEDLCKYRSGADKSLDKMKTLQSDSKEQTSLLAEAKAELEKQRQEIESLKALNEALERDNKALRDELDALKALLAKLQQELKEAQDELLRLFEQNKKLQADAAAGAAAEIGKYKSQLEEKQREIDDLNKRIADLLAKLKACEAAAANADAAAQKKYLDEIENLKKLLAAANAALEKCKADALANGGAKDKELADAKAALDKCRADLLALQQDLEAKLKACLAEKEALMKEIEANRKELAKCAKLLEEIEAEREKNRRLEAMLRDFENKLAAAGKAVPGGDADLDALNKLIADLRKQLQEQTDRNNELENQLKACRQDLQNQKDKLKALEAENAKLKDQAAKLADQLKQAQANLDGLRRSSKDAFDKQVKELEQTKSASLSKMQSLHEDSMRELLYKHEREIQALQLANAALRDSLSNLKGSGDSGDCLEQIKKQLEEFSREICKCVAKRVPCPMNRLQLICKKIIDEGIEALDIKELTYLHSEVYKAGLKLRPDISGQCKDKPCKCVTFSCNLPSVSREKEQKLLSRIICLENELEDANNILEHFKNNYFDASAATCQPSTAVTPERYSACRFNDEVNEFLKRTSCENTAAKHQ